MCNNYKLIKIIDPNVLEYGNTKELHLSENGFVIINPQCEATNELMSYFNNPKKFKKLKLT